MLRPNRKLPAASSFSSTIVISSYVIMTRRKTKERTSFFNALVRISPRCNPDFLVAVVVSAFEKSFATDSFTNKHAYKQLPISMIVVF